MPDLGKLIKAYDIRVPSRTSFNEDLAYQIGAAFARLVGDTVIVVREHARHVVAAVGAFHPGRDLPGPERYRRGPGVHGPVVLRGRLVGPTRRGLHPPATTRPATTASNYAGPVPASRAGQPAWPRSRAALENGIPTHDARPEQSPTGPAREYTAYLRGLVDLTGIRRLRSRLTPRTGWAGTWCPLCWGTPVARALPLDIVPMYFELGRVVPQHEANPLDPAQPG